MAAGHDLPQQQRVHRPEQVSAQTLRGIGPEHPVQRHDHGAEGQRLLQLQPERDPGQRRPAQLGRDPLGPGGHWTVHGYRGRPGGRYLAERNLLADRVTAVPQLQRGHDVGAVPDHRHPPVGGIRDSVGRARRRQHGHHRQGQERGRHDRAHRRPRAARHRHQPGDHPGAAQRQRDPQRHGHERGRQVQRVPPRRAGRPEHDRDGDVRARSRDRDDDEYRGRDGGRGQSADEAGQFARAGRTGPFVPVVVARHFARLPIMIVVPRDP